MAVVEKPTLDDYILEHYGVRGMKWGRRQGKSVTGISRARGAIIDRNDRDLKAFRDVKTALNTGKGTFGQRFTNRTNRMIMGKKLTEKFYDQQISKMTAQNARVKAGKLTFGDKVRSAAMRTMPLEMLVSIRPD